MKPIKKEDMPKLIVLIVLAVGIFAFAVVQMINLSPPSVAAVSAAAAASGAPGATSAPGAPGATSAPGAPGANRTTVVASATGAPLQDPSALDVPENPELDFLHIGPPTGGKDPFAPNGGAAPVTVAAVPTPAPIVSTPLPPPAPVKPENWNVKFPGAAGNGDGTIEVKEPNPAPAPVELPAPAWGVAGIVLAESDSDGIKRGRDVAILRGAAGDRRFVTVGDPVGNDYHVSAVRPGGVEIRSKKRVAMIRLDSSLPNTSNPSQRPGASTGSRN